MLRPVPKLRARQHPAVPDPVWQHPDAIRLVAASSDQVLTTIEILTQSHDLDAAECLLWIVEHICRQLSIPPLVYQAPDDSEPISAGYTQSE